MKRHNGRIIAVLTLYNMDLSKLSDVETLKGKKGRRFTTAFFEV